MPAAFSAFVIFYTFAGAPTLWKLPWAVPHLFLILVVLTATVSVVRRLGRTRKRFAEETLARNIVKRWEWDDQAAPQDLRETGLYADAETLQIDPKHLAFSPQYPLWTDGAAKRRWISLPPDSAIDASDPDAWIFPVGTRLWKEFSFNGRRVETRYMERRPDGQWLYAAYAWSADGRER